VAGDALQFDAVPEVEAKQRSCVLDDRQWLKMLGLGNDRV
jgi:hypothetical protein